MAKSEELIQNTRREFAKSCIDELWPLLEMQKTMTTEARRRTDPAIDWLWKQAGWERDQRP